MPLALRAQNPPEYQGFGATTPGGAGGTVVLVTNLDDSGPGSFREAVSQGNRIVVFDVAGDILLSDYVYVTGAFITIDGLTAPPPGITLRNRGLIIRGNRGAHDVIVRGIRVRDSPIDGIQIAYGAYNVVIDHVSVHGSGDGNLDITEGSHDVTVSWSILAEPTSGKNMLIKYNPSHITLHHNLFVSATTRNPQVRIDDAGTLATDTTVDMRNNLVRDWGIGYGTLIWYGPWANVVNNYYAAAGGGADDTLTVDAATAAAWVEGNVSEEGMDLDATGTELSAFWAPLVDTQGACAAARDVLAEAGVMPRDSIDQGYLDAITLAACPSASASLSVSPASLAVAAVLNGPVPPAQILSITNAGEGTLLWQATATTSTGGPWLAVAPASGTAPSALTVSVAPAGLVAGQYQGVVTVEADGATGSPQAIPVTLVVSNPPAKDLVIVGLGLSAGSVTAGSSVTVSYQVKNQGTATVTETYTDKIYLSTDATLDTGDVLLGQSHDHTADLNPNATHSNSQAVTVPGDAGSYFVLVEADALGAVTESLEGNNNVAAVALTVTAPPPPGKDLVIEGLGLSATSVVAGSNVTVSYRVANRGTVKVTETYTDKIYLSSDATWSAGDVLLGTSHGHTSNLSRNATHSHSQAVTVPAGTAGSYFVLVEADALDAVAESLEGNNVTATLVTVLNP